MDADDLNDALEQLLNNLKKSGKNPVPDMKESDLDCNCPWMECEMHSGTLCSNRAIVIEKCSPFCQDGPHYLGDGSFGEDIHLCKACGGGLMKFLTDEICILMQDFSEYVPNWMKPLEAMCRTAYKDAVTNAGWILPQQDAAAVLALAFIIVQMDEKKAIPETLLERLAVAKAKTTSMSKAFRMDGKEVGVSHE